MFGEEYEDTRAAKNTPLSVAFPTCGRRSWRRVSVEISAHLVLKSGAPSTYTPLSSSSVRLFQGSDALPYPLERSFQSPARQRTGRRERSLYG